MKNIMCKYIIQDGDTCYNLNLLTYEDSIMGPSQDVDNNTYFMGHEVECGSNNECYVILSMQNAKNIFGLKKLKDLFEIGVIELYPDNQQIVWDKLYCSHCKEYNEPENKEHVVIHNPIVGFINDVPLLDYNDDEVLVLENSQIVCSECGRPINT